jgi:SPP1 gp7 family putative phage head morphogenesis protein
MPVDQVMAEPEPVVEMGSPNAPGSPAGKQPAKKQDDEDDDRAEETAPEASDEDRERELLRPRIAAFMARRTARREQAWLKQLRRLVPLENAFRSKFSRWLRDLRAWQLNALSKAGAPRSDARGPDDKPSEGQIQEILFKTQEWGQRLVQLEHATYLQAATAGVEGAVQDLGGNFAFDVVDPRVVDVIAKRERVLLTNTPETIQRRVQRSLEEGVRNGETIRQLQERLKGDFNQFTNRRALMVARTEVAGVVNSSRHEVFAAEGVEQHEWTTARDEVVRDTHEEQDGDVVAIGTPFKNGLAFPGDPSGPPGEVINCRCVAIPV